MQHPMKKSFQILAIAGLLILSGCETETETVCLPQRVKSTFLTGNSITQDFKYTGTQLDRIVRSDFQTDHFDYDDVGGLLQIRRINVQFLRKTETRLFYEGGRLSYSEDYRMNLDQSTQQDIDTALVGIMEYSWDGNQVSMIEHYEGTPGAGFNLASFTEYSYDLAGNMIESVTFNPAGDTTEAFSYVYDLQPHPFSSLDFPFEGITFVNNVVQSLDMVNGEEFTHQVVYGPTLFPDQVIIKSFGTNNEVIQYSYDCQ